MSTGSPTCWKPIGKLMSSSSLGHIRLFMVTLICFCNFLLVSTIFLLSLVIIGCSTDMTSTFLINSRTESGVTVSQALELSQTPFHLRMGFTFSPINNKYRNSMKHLGQRVYSIILAGRVGIGPHYCFF